jgi:transposase-like protein
VAACQVAGASVAGIALERQINANLLRRWIKEAVSKSALATGPRGVVAGEATSVPADGVDGRGLL